MVKFKRTFNSICGNYKRPVQEYLKSLTGHNTVLDLKISCCKSMSSKYFPDIAKCQGHKVI